ncbi:MAG TPA: carbamoyltransferase HypF, partial [Bacillota bacterium]|nr:carbamoyltransferase HypF [Bacillota bacterium]
GYSEFVIRESHRGEAKAALISPDIATCSECLRELEDPTNLRFGYPFINCTDCGPRLTIIEDTPYDRANTSMKAFPMCPHCAGEYHDPVSRRFHAQPNACPSCGPSLCLLDNRGQVVEQDPQKVIARAGELLKRGSILGIKGLGGYHLACDAGNPSAVASLRRRKYREDRPFALMVPDVETAIGLVVLSEAERNILVGKERPILLAKKAALEVQPPKQSIKDNPKAAEGVAPENERLGVMLPYTPVHHLLFQKGPRMMVMTSGNKSSEPIAFQDREAIDRLSGIADFFIVNNREIIRRCDDSVVTVFEDKPYFYRRSRGYAPSPIQLPALGGQILAVGGEQKNTFCLTKGKEAFISHHIGDLENLATLRAFEEGIRDYQKMFSMSPELIVHDLHPEYLSTKYALAADLPKLGVQHHEAHIVSCMAENHVVGPVLGVAFDGTGYGWDGHLWGGEFMVGDYQELRRFAHLTYRQLPGGSKAIEEPWRIGLVCLRETFGRNWRSYLPVGIKVDEYQLGLVLEMVEKQINSPLSSSVGRLFDAVASLLGVRQRVSYEGQAAVELEQAAARWINKRGHPKRDALGVYDFSIVSGDEEQPMQFCPTGIIRGLITDLEQEQEIGRLAWKFHLSVARLILKVAGEARHQLGINQVCLSGGVFQNMLLLKAAVELLRGEGFQVFIHRLVPCNDGGIALGQAVLGQAALDRAAMGEAGPDRQ